MAKPSPPPEPDPEATANGDFLFGDVGRPAGREVLSKTALLARLDVLIRGFEGCENVTVLDLYPLDIVDRKDGCNWGLTLLLDPAGVAPEVYALAYAQAISMARQSWNLTDEEFQKAQGQDSTENSGSAP